MFSADGTSISANGFNYAFQAKMELLAPEYNRSGVVKHFQIPVGSLIDSAGQSELSIDELLNNVFAVKNVKDPGGTSVVMKNAIINHALGTQVNQKLYASDALGFLSSEWVNGVIIEAPFTSTNTGAPTLYSLSLKFQANYAFNFKTRDPYSRGLEPSKGSTRPLADLNRTTNIPLTPAVQEQFKKPIVPKGQTEPTPSFFDGVLNSITNQMANFSWENALELGEMLVPLVMDTNSTLVNAASKLQQLYLLQSACSTTKALVDWEDLQAQIVYYKKAKSVWVEAYPGDSPSSSDVDETPGGGNNTIGDTQKPPLQVDQEVLNEFVDTHTKKLPTKLKNK
jgi:hypothetical protein